MTAKGSETRPRPTVVKAAKNNGLHAVIAEAKACVKQPMRLLLILSPMFKVLPRAFWHQLAETAAAIAVHTATTKQLKRNLSALEKDTKVPTDAILQRNLASYYRYFADLPALAHWNEEKIRRYTRLVNAEAVMERSRTRPIVAALTHSGNWDLAGARMAIAGVPVTTVAERIPDDRVWDFFCTTRAEIGIKILPAKHGVFAELKELMNERVGMFPLLADRDITGSGIEVELGEKALIAPGPAALALQTGAELVVAFIYDGYRGGNGPRRKDWVTTIEFVEVPIASDDTVETLTQKWIDIQAKRLREHPENWHMLQKLYVRDLDQKRLARARARKAAQLENAARTGQE